MAEKRFTYVCSKCGETAWLSYQTTKVTRFVGTSTESSRWDDRLDEEKDKPKTITINVTGLGTWRCPTHGKVPVKRFRRNLKGVIKEIK